MVPSHFAPNKDVKSAENAKAMREFALEQSIVYYEQGRAGIEHVLLPDDGWVLPRRRGGGGRFAHLHLRRPRCFAHRHGFHRYRLRHGHRRHLDARAGDHEDDLSRQAEALGGGGKDIILSTIGDIGTDGALYRAIEFRGEALSQLSMEQRFTITNMTIEAGGKAGLMVPDATTLGYVRARAKREWHVFEPDPDAEYVRSTIYEVSDLEPMVALPFSPDNVVP